MGIADFKRNLRMVSGVVHYDGLPPASRFSLQDLMSELYRLKHPYKPYCKQFTGSDIFLSILHPIAQFLTSGNGRTFVLVADKEGLKTVRKIATQMKRTRSRSREYPAEPMFYNPNMIIGDAGIASPADPTNWEPIDLIRLMDTRALRITLFKYISKRLVEYFQRDMGVRFRIVIDLCEKKNPIILTERGLQPVPDTYRPDGEGESALIRWLKIGCEQGWVSQFDTKRVHTVDTDEMMLLVLHFWDSPYLPNLIWQDWVTTARRTFFRVDNVVAALKRNGWTRERFVTACILSKCDYWDKQWLTSGISSAIIWYCAQHVPLPNGKFDSASSFLRLYRQIWSMRLQCDATDAAIRARTSSFKPRTRPAPFESHTEVYDPALAREVYKRTFVWLYTYWLDLKDIDHHIEATPYLAKLKKQRDDFRLECASSVDSVPSPPS